MYESPFAIDGGGAICMRSYQELKDVPVEEITSPDFGPFYGRTQGGRSVIRCKLKALSTLQAIQATLSFTGSSALRLTLDGDINNATSIAQLGGGTLSFAYLLEQGPEYWFIIDDPARNLALAKREVLGDLVIANSSKPYWVKPTFQTSPLNAQYQATHRAVAQVGQIWIYIDIDGNPHKEDYNNNADYVHVPPGHAAGPIGWEPVEIASGARINVSGKVINGGHSDIGLHMRPRV